ncbi:MAG: DUF4055 domain-containing protein [Candidatus Binatia bacterium]
MTVAAQSNAVLAMEAERTLPRTLMGGTMAMRRARIKYLPQEPAETDKAYEIRLERSFLFNGYAKTVGDMAGKVFTKPIALGDDMPPELIGYAENIDLTGQNLDVFSHAVFSDALAEGISYILVEMDRAPTNEDGSPVRLNRAQEAAMNRRPWMVHVKARQVLGWRSQAVNGVETLTQFRFIETVTEDDGEFGEEDVEQVRVFSREGSTATWAIYRRTGETQAGGTGGQAWALHDEGPITIGEIAICPVYVARTGFMRGTPPLANLAESNLAHWQSQSDQRNILHVARVPILFGAGIDDTESWAIGANRMVTSTNPEAKLEYVEHSGAAIESGRQDLKDLEFQMQVLGLELLVPKPGGQTATGAAIDQAKMNAPLSMMANALKDALEQAFGFMAMFVGLSRDQGGGSLTVNTDFGVSLRDAQDVVALLDAVKSQIISRETFIKEMQRRGVLADDMMTDEEIGRIAAEGFAMLEDDEIDGQ